MGLKTGTKPIIQNIWKKSVHLFGDVNPICWDGGIVTCGNTI